MTGFVHLRAREYDPQTGQFISIDPSIEDTRQPYAYAGNDPTLYTDHTGLDFWNDLATNALAFGAGVLNGVTFGLSGMIMSAVIPGYNCFVEANSGFYTAGDIVGMVGSAVVATVMTAGAGGVVVGGVVAARIAVAASARVTATSVRTTATTAVRSASATSVRRPGNACVANSFAPGTLVLMADGSTEPIEMIELGDEVWAADPETGEAGARPVTALIEGTGEKDLVTVTTESGSVVATAGHPFWSASEASWVDAGDLRIGDAVLELDGSESVVTATSEATVQATVHNLTVAQIHTYFVFVGDAPTLVHNASCPVSQGATFMADANGTVVPLSRRTLEEGFDAAGLASVPTRAPGVSYTLPDGSIVRVMEPSGSAGLRASFTNSAGGPVSPFTGRPVQPPPGLSTPDIREYVRVRTHVELNQ